MRQLEAAIEGIKDFDKFRATVANTLAQQEEQVRSRRMARLYRGALLLTCVLCQNRDLEGALKAESDTLVQLQDMVTRIAQDLPKFSPRCVHTCPATHAQPHSHTATHSHSHTHSRGHAPSLIGWACFRVCDLRTDVSAINDALDEVRASIATKADAADAQRGQSGVEALEARLLQLQVRLPDVACVCVFVPTRAKAVACVPAHACEG